MIEKEKFSVFKVFFSFILSELESKIKVLKRWIIYLLVFHISFDREKTFFFLNK